MAKIRVERSKFNSTANSIEEYIEAMKKNMAAADMIVDALVRSDWKGIDASAFKTEWKETSDVGSTYYITKSNLESYAKFLRAAEEKYKKAQEDAYNRANGLPMF